MRRCARTSAAAPLVVWWIAGVASVVTLLLARSEAPRLWAGLTSWPALLFVAAGSMLAPLSFAALRGSRFNLARLLGAAQIVTLLAGWAAAQWPYLIYPDRDRRRRRRAGVHAGAHGLDAALRPRRAAALALVPVPGVQVAAAMSASSSAAVDRPALPDDFTAARCGRASPDRPSRISARPDR